MSRDPYHDVRQEIESSLQAAENLRASYVRIRSTARGDTEELQWARNEFKATLATLEGDLDDLEESVKIVESTGAASFGINKQELSERRNYVNRTRKLLQNMRDEASSTTINHPLANGNGNQEDDQEAWAQQEQQMMIEHQDRTLDSISGTLHTLAAQAGLVGQEISEHNELLQDLEGQVDRTEGKLAQAQKKMDFFLRKAEENRWSVYILIAVLCVLLILVVVL